MFKKIQKNSLVYKFTVSISLVVFFLFTILLLSNMYSLKVVKENTVKSSKNAMEIYLNSMNGNLNDITKDLDEIFSEQIDDLSLFPDFSEEQRYFKSLEIKDLLISKLTNNNASDGFYIMEQNSDLFLAEYSSRIPGKEGITLIDFLRSKDFATIDTTNKDWNIVKMNDTVYFFYTYKISHITIGTFVKAKTLMSLIESTTPAEIEYLLTDQKGNILPLSKKSTIAIDSISTSIIDNANLNQMYYIHSAEIPQLGMLWSFTEKKSAFSGLELIPWLIVILGLLSILIVPYTVIRLSKEIIKPVLVLAKATKEVEKGNLDYQIPPIRTSREFTELNHSFDSMVKEIKALKIHSYEEKLERNKAEIRYLQMQIKPHFFLNAISTITSLTFQNKNEEIRKMIHLLSKHLRYTLKGGLIKVSIQDEIGHVKNYIQMMDIKFPDSIFYLTDIDSELKSYPIPQLLIQTFVENTFKHAFTIDDMLSIFIKVEKYHTKDEDFIRIVIEDSGEGFPDRVIQTVNSSEIVENSTGNQIGMTNMKKTLNLLYKKDGLLNISNSEPTGAKVELLIPLAKQEEVGTVFNQKIS
jgi:two-component system, sensor histidine kinase YesM